MVYGKNSMHTSQAKAFLVRKIEKILSSFEQLNQHTQAISEKSTLTAFWIYDHEYLEQFGNPVLKGF